MNIRILNIGISSEQDIVGVRQRSRQISELLAFNTHDQVRIATAVSEVTRNAFLKVSGARVIFSIDEINARPHLVVSVRDDGGKQKLATLNESEQAGGQLESAVVTAQRLMDSCTISQERGGGSTITLAKLLPHGAPSKASALAALGAELAVSPLATTFSEMQRQNQELVATMAELRERQDDLISLTRELEDTNRGVVALYAEIEEKAEKLRKADEMKSRFLSNTSHELRTPLGSISALAKLLLDRMDGELTSEQERQVRYIAVAAGNLSELVNDLLDLVKIEAGKEAVNLAEVDVSVLFSTLKGMLRPLINQPDVDLVFDYGNEHIVFISDEGKIAQILRNFVSNAMKFTEAGEVRVTASVDLHRQYLRFSVSDTGIGIAPENLTLIFEEFSQIEHPLQGRTKGTGLGLPLCKKLAALLGGDVEVSSEPGKGSVFNLRLPFSTAILENSPAIVH
ncbi:sensor histidine kinase [Undibacterium sp. TJN19]|uniref:sensor histidine kinase n=1 Tax=Undibacterium sp. TJN19 TaxID=3413055 RepID=UPI003BF186CB